MMYEKICPLPECGKAFKTKAWYQVHCSVRCGIRSRALTSREDILAYFMENVEMSEDEHACWRWKGSYTSDTGYGMAFVNSTKIRAHRLSYELFVGTIDRPLSILHACNNRWCVNWRHLRQGTDYDNAQDRIAADHQPRGSKHYMTHLREYDVRNIRSLYATKRWKLEELAARYQVNMITIHDIIKAKTWTHVDADTYVPPTDQRAVLTPEKVRELRQLRETEGLMYRQLAERFGITTTQACSICKRHSWKHVE